MKSITKIIVAMAISTTGFFAHADVASIKAERIMKLEAQLNDRKAEVAKIEATLTNGATFSVTEGKHLVVVTASLAATLKSIANSLESQQKDPRIIVLKASAAGLTTLASAEATLFAVDFGFLMYAMNVKKGEISRLTDQIEMLQAQ